MCGSTAALIGVQIASAGLQYKMQKQQAQHEWWRQKKQNELAKSNAIQRYKITIFPSHRRYFFHFIRFYFCNEMASGRLSARIESFSSGKILLPEPVTVAYHFCA